jgi:hypothetical protein
VAFPRCVDVNAVDADGESALMKVVAHAFDVDEEGPGSGTDRDSVGDTTLETGAETAMDLPTGRHHLDAEGSIQTPLPLVRLVEHAHTLHADGADYERKDVADRVLATNPKVRNHPDIYLCMHIFSHTSILMLYLHNIRRLV